MSKNLQIEFEKYKRRYREFNTSKKMHIINAIPLLLFLWIMGLLYNFPVIMLIAMSIILVFGLFMRYLTVTKNNPIYLFIWMIVSFLLLLILLFILIYFGIEI